MGTKSAITLSFAEAEKKFFDFYTRAAVKERAIKMIPYIDALIWDGQLKLTPEQAERGITTDDLRTIFLQVDAFINNEENIAVARTIFFHLKEDLVELAQSIERLGDQLQEGNEGETYLIKEPELTDA